MRRRRRNPFKMKTSTILVMAGVAGVLYYLYLAGFAVENNQGTTVIP